MPLSDREQQILSDIEAHLRAEDPRLVRTVGTTARAPVASSKLKLAGAAFAVGVLLLFGLAFHLAYALAGTALMLGASVYAGRELSRTNRRRRARPPRQGTESLRRYLDRRNER